MALGEFIETGAPARASRQPIRIGLEMPAWLPRRLHMPARVLLGMVIGTAMGVYALALALEVDRILTATQLGLAPSAMTLSVLNMSLMVMGAVALHHGLTRARDNLRTDL